MYSPPPLTPNVVFWVEIIGTKKCELKIDELKLLEFLAQNEFGRCSERGKTFIARKVDGCICRVSTEQVRDFVFNYVRDLPKRITFSFENRDLQELLIKKPSLFSRTRLRWLAWLNESSHKVGGSNV